MQTVSVIVPVYNAEDHLGKCVESILNQSHRDLQLILVDDGSTDRSSEMCDTYARQDDRIVIIHQSNAGVSAARNTGISAATGVYIGFVDSDDWIEADMFETLVNAIKDNHAEIAMCDVTTVYSNGKTEKDTIVQLPKSINLQHQDMTAKVLLELAGSACRCLYSRELIIKKQITFPTGIKFSEDRIFNLYAMGYAKSVCYVKESYYNRYMNVKSAVHRFHPDYFEAYKLAAEGTEKAIRAAWENDPDYQTAYLSQFKSGALMAINNYYYKTSTFSNAQRRAAVKKVCNDKKLRDAIVMSGANGIQESWILKKNVTMLVAYARLANWKHGR